MKPVYIFCESYPQLENTLFVLEQNYQSEKSSIVIVIKNPDLLKLFEHLKQSKYGPLLNIIHLSYTSARLKNKLLDYITNLVAEKTFLDAAFRQHFKGVQGATIYFFCRVFTQYTFYVLTRLRKCNSLVYVDDRDYKKIELIKVRTDSLRTFLGKIRLRITCGEGIRLVRFPQYGEVASYIGDNFVAMVDQHITHAERKQWLKGFSLTDLSFVDEGNFALVFYDTGDSFVQLYLSGKEDYYETMQDIFSMLVKYFNKNQVLIKHHPASEETMVLSAYGRVVPAFVPGEVLQREGVLLLGIFSTCIYEARAGYPVSLINLFKFKDRNVKDVLTRSTLGRATCGVLFPETLDDLERIVQKSREGLIL